MNENTKYFRTFLNFGTTLQTNNWREISNIDCGMQSRVNRALRYLRFESD